MDHTFRGVSDSGRELRHPLEATSTVSQPETKAMSNGKA